MKSSRLLALVGVTVAAVIAAVVLSMGPSGPTGDRASGTAVLPGFAQSAEQADHVVLVHGDQRVTLVRLG